MRLEDDIRDFFREKIEAERQEFLKEEPELRAEFEGRLIKKRPGAARDTGRAERSGSLLIAAAAVIIMLTGAALPASSGRYADMPGVEALRELVSAEKSRYGSFSALAKVARHWTEREEGVHLFGGVKR